MGNHAQCWQNWLISGYRLRPLTLMPLTGTVIGSSFQARTMNQSLSRREFIVAASATAAAATLLPSGLALGQEFKTKIRKAKIIGPVTENTLMPLKEAGFDGVETTTVCDDAKASHSREVAEKMGMRVHSVLRGWMEFNSDNPKQVEDSLEQTRASLRAAHAYGADDILLVPCRVGGMPMPEPWEFKIEFD